MNAFVFLLLPRPHLLAAAAASARLPRHILPPLQMDPYAAQSPWLAAVLLGMLQALVPPHLSIVLGG